SALLKHRELFSLSSGFPPTTTHLQQAGDLLMYNVTAACGYGEGLHGAFERISSVSRLKYERVEGRGRIIFARRDHPALCPTLRFKAPTRLADARSVRKLLEI